MTGPRFARNVALFVVLTSVAHAAAQATRPATKPAKKVAPPPAVSWKDGRLNYVADSRGNRVPDFSYAGYAAGERPIPTVAAKLRVGAPAGDNTHAIQAAIDQVSALPTDAAGLRGAVLIPPGQYDVNGSLTLHTSGVVLRGSGVGDDGTVLRATGHARRTVVEIKGQPQLLTTAEQPIEDRYVPVNAMTLSIHDTSGFKAGDAVVICRPSTPEWIAAIGMDDLGGDRHGPSWRPGSRDITWHRTIMRIEGKTLILDAPLTMTLDAEFGGATVAKVNWPGRVQQCGVENLRIASAFDAQNSADEEHAWFGVGIINARDCWVRQATFENLAGSAVAVWETASRVTVEDCQSRHPVGEVGGLRRYSFFVSGQQVLMQRLYSEAGYHDFATGFAAAGPNAFVQCESRESLGESGPIDSAASGTLFDRVRIDGQALSLRNRTYQGQGIGWASFNGVIWNSTAALIECWQPPGAQNWSFGASAEFAGNGAFSGSNDDVNPDSLFYAQLAARIGKEPAVARSQLLLPPVNGSRAPTLEDAAIAIEISKQPRVDMAQWARAAATRNPIPNDKQGIGVASVPVAAATPRSGHTLKIVNGWLTFDGRLATGSTMGVPWWNGSVRPGEYAKASPALTRFVPGRTGTGLTDDLPTVVKEMVAGGRVAVFQHPPLWYERRRDDHERVQRMDGDVVAPFYETPWARSGQGRASDGLSKWDVTKPNRWYFDRLRAFADLASQHDLLLFNGLYMQHNLLEAGAHYFDAPWRPANNVNNVGIPEPVFFAGDKLIYVAEQFYDVTDPARRALHRTYIRNALNELADKPNVIFFLSDEYTGPLAFTEFWLDTIAEWQTETGKRPLVALYATKDVTDAVLANPKRSAVVSMIYNKFNNEGDAGWWYQPGGKPFAPQGGKNLAPRQWARLLKPKPAGFAEVYRAVYEYRTKYPDKPFIYDGPETLGWAVLLGGGSIPPVRLEPDLAAILPTMKPTPGNSGYIGLKDPGETNLLVYATAGEHLRPLAEQHGTFEVRRIDMVTGRSTPWTDADATQKPTVLWLRKK